MTASRVHRVSDGTFRLDGGAMFGVVPRVLWEKARPPDARNRILLGLNCMLVAGPDYLALVDTGLGDKRGARFADLYDVDRKTTLAGSLADLDVAPADVTHVVLTHLHFDHCGGNIRRNAAGEPAPAFPNARHFVQRGEWEDAARGAPGADDYLPAGLRVIEAAGLLDLVDGEASILPGLTLLPTPGHTRHHQSVLVRTPRGAVLFAGDLIPTASHLAPAWNMAYDLYPVTTRETKGRVLARLREEGWRLFLEHEPGPCCGDVAWVPHKDGERPEFRPLPCESL
ncbi:MAG: MBL fold metallo-hydrolase [Candidatus Krumholzibacteriota bacterium]|nr:MBL fold metallo-hydrolase [Candidatus Krumholzibacteriota bacterium]